MRLKSLFLAGAALLTFAGPAFAEPLHYTPDSSIAFTLVHPMHRVTGTSHALKGKFVLPPLDHPEQGSLQVAVPVQSFDSGDKNRDMHMLEIIDAAKYPGVIFKSESLQVTLNEKRGEGVYVKGIVKGTLMFHGKSRPLSAPFEATSNGSEVSASTEFDVSLTEFAIERPALLMVPVEDKLHMAVKIVAK